MCGNEERLVPVAPSKVTGKKHKPLLESFEPIGDVLPIELNNAEEEKDV